MIKMSVFADSALRAMDRAKLTPEALDRIGRYGVSLVRKDSTQSFVRQADPTTGQAWKPIKHRRRGDVAKAQILIDTGRLRRAVGAEHSVSGQVVEIRGGIRPVVYGRIHQFGGRTAPHVILPRKAKVLRWTGSDGGSVFARRVNHPGSVIPARPYVGISQQSVNAFSDFVKRQMLGTVHG
jgi:phage gpG-like protein